MMTIAQAVQEFIESEKWICEQLEDRQVRVVVTGDNGRWTWTAGWNETDTLFISHSFCPVKVPVDRRRAVAEFLTRANYGLTIGNFEMNLDDGTVFFNTRVPLKEDAPTVSLIRELAYCNLSLMDRYLPGLLEVAFGNADPKKAIEKIDQLPVRGNDEGPKEAEEQPPLPRPRRGLHRPMDN